MWNVRLVSIFFGRKNCFYMGVRMFESKTNSWLSIFSIEPSLCPILGGRRVSVKGQQQQVRLVFSMKTVFSFDPSMRCFLAERMIGCCLALLRPIHEVLLIGCCSALLRANWNLSRHEAPLPSHQSWLFEESCQFNFRNRVWRCFNGLLCWRSIIVRIYGRKEKTEE